MKSLARILGFLVVAVPFAARAAQVSLDLPVGPAHRIVASVAEKSGMNLKVEDHFAKDILFVRVQDVDVEDVLTKIAEVTAGRWRTLSDGTRILGPDPGALNRHEAEFRKRRVDFLGNKMRAYTDETLNSWYRPEIPDYAKREGYENLSADEFRPNPSSFLLAKCVALLNPSVLGSLKKGDRMVFSTTPTRMQSNLTISQAAVAEYLARVNELAKNTKERLEATPPRPRPDLEGMTDAEVKLLEQVFGSESVPNSVQRTPPAKILVILSRPQYWTGGYGGNGGVFVEVLVLDQEGTVIDTDREFFYSDARLEELERSAWRSSELSEDESEGPPVYKAKFPITSGPIENSELTKSLRAFQAAQGSPTTPISKELKEAFADPETYDLLGFHVEDAIRSIGKHASKNIVAYLQDGVGEFVGEDPEGHQLTTQEFYDRLIANDLQVVNDQGAWLTIMPPSLEEARLERVSRAGLKKLLTVARSGKTPALDDIADFAATSPSFDSSGIMGTHLIAANSDFIQIIERETLDWDVLRAYGLLTRSQRESALKGRSIRLSSLTATQRDAFRSIIFGASYRTKPVENANARDEVVDLFRTLGINNRRKPPVTYAGEPTEALPWGIPGEATLTLGSVDDEVYRFVDSGEDFEDMPYLGTTGLAFLQVYLELAPTSESDAAEMRKLMETMQVGARQTINLKLHLNDLVEVNEPLSVDQFDQGAGTTTASQLPKAQLDKIAAAVARLRAHPIIKYLARESKREATERVEEGAERPPPPSRR